MTSRVDDDAALARRQRDRAALAEMQARDAQAAKAGRCCVGPPGAHEETCDGTGRELCARVAYARDRLTR